MSTKSKETTNKGLLVAAGIAILSLLALSGYLWSNQKTANEKLATLSATNVKQEEDLAVLDEKFSDAKIQLDEMRTNNEELNTKIDEQQAKLLVQKKKIARLIRSGKNLKKARAEMDVMTAQIAQYINEINTLKEQNAQLVNANADLSQEKAMLTSKVEQITASSEVLAIEKDDLLSKTKRLSSVNDQLSKKVTAASAIKAVSIAVSPVKIRKSGKEVKKRYAKSIDKINICFDADANRVTDGGVEIFYVRIINPLGETLAVESLGSGTLTSNDTDDEVRYTKKVEVQYDNKAQNDICIGWAPGTDFMRGDYEVEIFNKGYVTGRTSFKLK